MDWTHVIARVKFGVKFRVKFGAKFGVKSLAMPKCSRMTFAITIGGDSVK